MASAFTAQLRNIALNSTHELDLRARRNAHAESLLFPREVAAKQDFETLYAICTEGFRELCALDANIAEFERNLFSAQSVQTEREQMNKTENEALDKVLERCLAMLGGKLLLKPGVKCLEWLVRRFRVHVYNTSALLLAVLPWHELSVWRNVLSVVPKEKCTGEWKMLGMYKEEALNVPRKAVVYAMTNNDGFFTLVNRYVLDNARDGITHSGLLKFWTGTMIEAVVGRLDATRSGRKEVQRQRTEDLLLKVLPLLSDGFEVRGIPDLTTACFTLAMVLVGKAGLDDRVLDSLLQAVAIAAQYPETEKKTAIITMTVIVGQKQHKSLPKDALEFFMDLTDLHAVLTSLNEGYAVGVLAEALVNSALHGLKRKNVAARLGFAEKVIRISSSIVPQSTSTMLRILLARVIQLQDGGDTGKLGRLDLTDLLQRLNEEPDFSTLIAEAARALSIDSTTLESLIGSTVSVIEPKPEKDTDAMDLDVSMTAIPDINEILAQVPSRTVDTTSFLAGHDQHLYSQLVECFKVCCKSVKATQNFLSLPIWQTSSSQGMLIRSFLARVAVGPFASNQKAAALRFLSLTIQDVSTVIDVQALLPYALVALCDSSQNVRKAAAELAILMGQIEIPQNQDATTDQLYEHTLVTDLREMSAVHLQKIINQALVPSIEECVLDSAQVGRVVQQALNGPDAVSQTPTKSNQVDLKKSLRHELFKLLEIHAVATPLLKVKTSIISLLGNVHKVGTDTKSKVLAPLLETWSTLERAAAEEAVNAEQLSLDAVDAAMAQIIVPQDKDAAGRVIALIDRKESTPRSGLVKVLFERLQNIWKSLKHDVQVATSHRMFELAFEANADVSRGAQGVLRSVDLTTDILGTILELSMSGIAQMHVEEQQPKKRRRTSRGRDSLPPDLARMFTAASSRLTFALELVDDSNPQSRPELLPVLFDVLATMKRLKSQQRLDLPYLHNLCLSNILAIIEGQQSLTKPTIDLSSIRADLVTDCIRSADNPQVRTTALLLSSSLAAIAPDRMLHNVMPILTFMGQNMFSKDDDHSVFVVNQAIDMLVPALVASLRKQNKDLIKSTSGLLASFTTAFDHIPQHRRVSTYARLLDRMGSQEFAFVILAMLAKRRAKEPIFESFLSDLLAELDPYAQLITIQKVISLASDLVSNNPQSAEEIFEDLASVNAEERHNLSRTVLNVALAILQSKSLKSRASKMHKLEESLAERVRSEINNCFQLILSTIRDCRRQDIDIVQELKECLDALLALPSYVELFSIIPQVLSSEDVEADLKPQALRVLATKLQRNPHKDSRTRLAAMELLVKLADRLHVEEDVAIKQAIVVCIDPLCEVYGRQDLETVVYTANIVSSDQCLGLGDRRLEIMSILCLASMIEVLKEACIPLVPNIISRLRHILDTILQLPTEDDEVHNATFALLTAVVTHVPFLFSGDGLQSLVLLSSMSAAKYKSASATESRKEATSTMARKIDLQTLLIALLGEDLKYVREHPEDAELESLDMLSVVLETATKSTVVKNADNISQLLLAHLGQRGSLLRIEEASESMYGKAIQDIEKKLNAVSIQFIYKLNDTAFRPIFESWVEWATNAYDVESTGLRDTMTPGRRTSLFGLLNHFFDSLKSIVTSYASYVIPLSHETLVSTESIASTPKSSQLIDTTSYKAFLDMLRSMFVHDADAFFSTPSHFEPIAAPLISQLKLAATKSLRNSVYTSVLPAIIALATATLDTPSHHQTLSHGLVQLRHSSSAAVRLASIKTFAAITADDDVGEEFIANVIGIGSGEGEGARGIGGGGSVGEVMIYVNEMLEDDDEEVEREVRKWVQVVRERTGEDVFEV